MSEVQRLPKTKREFATLYRKAAKRILEDGKGIQISSIGTAGMCGEGKGCLGGQFMAVSGVSRIQCSYDDDSFGWVPTTNMCWTKSLGKAVEENQSVQSLGDEMIAYRWTIVGINDWILSQFFVRERDEIAAKILRRAAYLLDHGGEI